MIILNCLVLALASAAPSGPAPDAPSATEAASGPCGAISLESGAVRTDKPLSLSKPAACMPEIARLLRENSRIATIVVTAQVSDADRAGGKGLPVAQKALDALVAAGVPAEKLSAVAPRLEANGASGLFIRYTERPPAVPLGRVVELVGAPSVTLAPGELVAAKAGGIVRAGQILQTDSTSAVLVRLAGCGTLRLNPDSAARISVRSESAAVRVFLQRGSAFVRGCAGLEVESLHAVAKPAEGWVRFSALEGGELRAEVLEGQVVLAGADKTSKTIPAGRAARSSPATDAPRELLAAPVARAPLRGRYPTAPVLSWAEVPTAARYLVEVARSADFALAMVQVAAARESPCPAAVTSGKWFWRVAAVDRDGFAGRPSKIYAFEVGAPQSGR